MERCAADSSIRSFDPIKLESDQNFILESEQSRSLMCDELSNGCFTNGDLLEIDAMWYVR